MVPKVMPWKWYANDSSNNWNETINYTLKVGGRNYVDFNTTITTGITFGFYPTQPVQTEVAAWGQTNALSAITMDNNLTEILDIFVKLNETNANIVLKLSNSSTYSDALTINTSYQKIYDNLSVDEIQYIWAWADHNAPTAVWDPKLEIMGVKQLKDVEQ